MRPQGRRDRERQPLPCFDLCLQLRTVAIRGRKLDAVSQSIFPPELRRRSAPLLLEMVRAVVWSRSAKVEHASACCDGGGHDGPVQQMIGTEVPVLTNGRGGWHLDPL